MPPSSSRAYVLTLLISPFLEQARLDAGLAAELDPCYGKAHYRCHSCVTRVTCAPSHTDTHRRKGIATLGMPETQQRSKEAVMALQVRLCVCMCMCVCVSTCSDATAGCAQVQHHARAAKRGGADAEVGAAAAV